MTTSKSPLSQLRAQADQIATMLKDAERGIVPKVAHAEKIMAARATPTVKVGIIMDDKVLAPEIPWETIKSMSQPELARWIVRQMRKEC